MHLSLEKRKETGEKWKDRWLIDSHLSIALESYFLVVKKKSFYVARKTKKEKKIRRSIRDEKTSRWHFQPKEQHYYDLFPLHFSEEDLLETNETTSSN